jgi:UDP-N-acetylmuramate dehydrogenase
MNCQRTKEELTNLIAGEIRLHEPMTGHTTWQIGGPADILVLPKDKQEVLTLINYARNQGIACTVLGNGSNLLVRDQGIRGLVIKLGFQMSNVTITENTIVMAEAGVLLPKLASIFLKERLAGMEFAAGIPAALGGAVVMNASAHGVSMASLVTKVTVVDPRGQLLELAGMDLGFAYRKSNLQGSGMVVVAVELIATQDNPRAIEERMKANLYYRRSSQPLGHPNAGSVFKNPPGAAAGKIIEEAGAKGLRFGGAMVSEKHANFIINTGGASARDVLDLMEQVQEIVQKRYDILLEPEVHVIGEG